MGQRIIETYVLDSDLVPNCLEQAFTECRLSGARKTTDYCNTDFCAACTVTEHLFEQVVHHQDCRSDLVRERSGRPQLLVPFPEQMICDNARSRGVKEHGICR